MLKNSRVNIIILMNLESAALDRILTNIPLFSGLSVECISSLVPHCRMLSLQRGETLFRKGDEADGFYFVFDGKVKLYFVSEKGVEKIIEVLSPGMTFGEAVVLIGKPFPVYAETLMPSHLLFVHREGLLQSVEKHNQMALRMLAGVSRRLHGLIGGMEAVCVLSSRERVIGYLLNELDHHSGECIELPATKAVVASTLNLTPETFSRIVHGLEKEEILRVEGRTIEILEPQRLRECAAC